MTYPVVKLIGMVSPLNVSSSHLHWPGKLTSLPLLDWLLGAQNESITYRRAELKPFVSLGVEDKLQDDEVALLGSVLEFAGKKVREILVSGLSDVLNGHAKKLMTQTPMDDVFTLSAEKIVVSLSVCPDAELDL